MSETIFNQNTNSDTVVTDPQPTSTLPQELEEFVGEGKKYKSVDEALKSVPHAQKHIQKMEDELRQAREELAQRRAAEDILNELKSGQNNQGETTTQPKVDPDKIVETVLNSLTAREQANKAQANTASVASTFREKFGEKAEEVYNKLATDSGMTVQALNQLSALSPLAVLKLAGFDKKQEPSGTSIHGSVNTESLQNTQQPQTLSARVKPGASTKDLVTAWKAAGEKVKQST